jgi:hypothetical protein
MFHGLLPVNEGYQMQSVFISHSSSDAEFADRLVGDLRDQHYEARSFADVIPKGEELSQVKLDSRLGRAIFEDSFFVPILTPAAVQSPWIRKELAVAVKSESQINTVKVLPVLGEPCILPPELGLRSPVDFTRSYQEGLAGLLAVLTPPDPSSSALDVTLQLPGNTTLIRDIRQQLKRAQSKLFELNPVQFEQLIADVLRTHGYEVQLTQRTNDAGIDLIALSSWNRQRVPLYFQCKRYVPNKQITLECVDFIVAAAKREGVSHGLLIADAAGFALEDSLGGKGRWRTRCTYDINRTQWTDLFAWLANSSGVDVNMRSRVDAARLRHAHLTDKRFGSRLQVGEKEELEQLEFLLDAADSPFYEPIKQRLRSVRDHLLENAARLPEGD